MSTETEPKQDPETPPEGEPTSGQAAQQDPPSGDGGEQHKPEKIGDVLAGLDDDARRIVQAEINRKNNENKNLRTRLTEAEPKAKAHDDAQAAQQSAEERATQREQQATERADKAVQRMVRAEVRAMAADKFADADDAATFIDAAQYLGSDGEPDTDGIRSALDDLLSRKPHLAKQDPKPRAPAPNPAQGSSGQGAAKLTGPERGKQLFNERHGRKEPAAS